MRNQEQEFGITVGELIERLQLENQDAELYLGGLQFYRVKKRGDDLVQIEFEQQVFRDAQGVLVVQELR